MFPTLRPSIFAAHLEELEQLLKGIARLKELTLRTRDYLVSFGECMSTRIFAAYLNEIGAKAQQVSLLEQLWHVSTHFFVFFHYTRSACLKNY